MVLQTCMTMNMDLVIYLTAGDVGVFGVVKKRN